MTLETYFNVHLVSDPTGETLNAVMRADLCTVRQHRPARTQLLPGAEPQAARARAQAKSRMRRAWCSTPSPTRTCAHVWKNAAGELGSPTLAVIDGAVNMLSRYLGLKSAHKVAGQYHLDSEYFERIETINFALQHDDGQHTEHLREADVVLVGVSRTSKTPTCVYLGNRGVKAGERAAGSRRRCAGHSHAGRTRRPSWR